MNIDPTKYNEAVEQIVRDLNFKVEKWTHQQLVDLIKQLLASGDIVKYVTDDGRQALVYQPFAEVERLRAIIEELNQKLDSIPTDEDF